MMYAYTPPPLCEKLNDILDQAKKLHPLPASVHRLLRVLDNDDATVTEVAKLFALDQALTVQILQAANAAAMGYTSNCSSVHDAVMRLGFSQAKIVVLSSFAKNSLSQQLKGYKLGAGALWEHSVATAQYARQISKVVGYKDPDEAYVAGLLHDVGKLLLDQYVLDDYHKIIKMMKENNISVWQAEETMFGIDHARLGGLVAKQWGLPKILVEAIQHHHLPSFAWQHKELSAIVNIANSFTPKDTTSMAGLDGRLPNPIAVDILHLDSYALDQLWKQTTQAMQKDPGLTETLTPIL